MRALVLSVAVLLSACGKDDSEAGNAAVTQNISAETIASNDTTSIDAATGADANMAEDVQLTVNDLESMNVEVANDAADNEL